MFAGSVILIVGIVYPPVLNQIGDTKAFLLIAGMAGIIYPIVALFPDNERKPRAPRKAKRQDTPEN